MKNKLPTRTKMPSFRITLKVLKDAINEVFPRFPFRIVGVKIDNLTGFAQYAIKIKRIPTPVTLTTYEIINHDKCLISLSQKDRQTIHQQYLKELQLPQAYIEEFPIQENPNGDYIFKIVNIEDKSIISASATDFMNKYSEILMKLNKSDIVKISIFYHQENFEKSAANKFDKKIHFLI